MPPTDAEVIVAELRVRMDGFERNMEQGFDRLDRRVENLSYVSIDRYEADQRATHDDVQELKGAVKTAIRALVGLTIAVIGSVLTLIVETRGGV